MALAINLLVQVEVFAILAISFNLLLGYAGLFSISQAVFYGLGAYTAGIVATQYGVNLFIGMLAGVILTGIVGAVVGTAAVRVSDEFLVGLPGDPALLPRSPGDPAQLAVRGDGRHRPGPHRGHRLAHRP